MAAQGQEPKTPLHEASPTEESPTGEFVGKQGDAFSTTSDRAASDSQETLDLLLPGRMLGQYRILERLGAGGMGQVYKAVHPVMERVVALKIISPRLMQEPSARARFQREVRNAARLIHPNIVVAYDAAEVDGLWFLVMEYIDGQDVARLLMRYGRPSVGLACEIIRQAALGLQYAHEHGMVHRDIKPANLMVANARQLTSAASGLLAKKDAAANSERGWPKAVLVKILDFGLARLSAGPNMVPGRGETLTREGCIVGTPEFMAPEQARDSRLADIRSDIYSLGCTLYMLLAGRPPFQAASSLELAVLHLSQPPEPIAHFNPALPPELSALVHRMLAKQPEDRFQTPGEVAAALQPWAQPGIVAVPPPSPPPVMPPLSPFALPPESSPGSSIVPADSATSPTSATDPPTFAPQRSVEKPKMPPSVLMMHFQALLRTLVLTIIFAILGIICIVYLPELGSYLHQLWQRITPQTTKTMLP